ncbi:hypothetical protein AMECASPLE_010904 [Ameca splendens]|uniref:Uncharacterized protein n=1 Tax=Ameca splendens TaxID=208324 RepID=A0ABV1A6Y9_9TELE
MFNYQSITQETFHDEKTNQRPSQALLQNTEGSGHRRISKLFKGPVNTVGAIIWKWKECKAAMIKWSCKIADKEFSRNKGLLQKDLKLAFTIPIPIKLGCCVNRK